MAISTIIATIGEAPKERKPRIKKADRDFAPEGSGFRECRYDLQTLVRYHFERARNDAEYGSRWERYYLTERQRLLAEETESARKRDAALAAKAAGKPERRPYVPKVRASELDDCERKVTFRLLQFNEEPIMVGHGQWGIPSYLGTFAHQLLEIALRFLGISKKAEYRVISEEYQFTGRVDHIIDGEFFRAELGPDAMDAVLDVKTVKHEEFLEGAWNKKMEKYRAQVNAYCHQLGLKLGIILLQSRDSGDVMAIEWDVNEEEGLAMLQKAKHAAELRDARVLGEPSPDFFYCNNFCPFKTRCDRAGQVQAALDEGANPKEL